MSELKCPFCQQELQEDVGYDGDYSCPNCRQPYFGSPELWQELIRTQELLEIESAEHSMCHTQMLKTTEKLERTRKALDVALDWLWQVATPEKCDDDLCREFTKRKLAEIKTALEQKDK